MTLPIPLSPPRMHRLPAMVAFGATDVGPVRSNNEDNFLFDETLGLAMLADGMGGHAAGELASAGVLVEMRDYLARHAHGVPLIDADTRLAPDADSTWSDPAAGAKRLLHEAVAHANAHLYAQNRARRHADGSGMGATLTGFWRPTAEAPLVAFHVGDSRLYRMRDGVLDQLTRDQTLYQQALESGIFEQLPARNLLLQAVGPAPSITAEVRSHPVREGDVLMLCSDGLHGSVPTAELGRVLEQVRADSLGHDCARLIGMAKANGGRDNITVLLALCLPHRESP
ncbi:PP2C family serine/threonine-protein phosphatase [Massilia sp. ZL223]|uniref:PP2C family protein-serine/threonine phosphatase n=1 Tax=Massilia sp. ZL223 TaxID=2824904 RepID=UPI001B83B5B8|nr:protein phosphatase 2C domain-containing protein [Massilia sp. ZL223]MBQ5965077.1 serine/threonine-protein phosphatase [Massilia sp. ZL223]